MICSFSKDSKGHINFLLHKMENSFSSNRCNKMRKRTDNLVIMSMNMLARGLLDSFLRSDTMKIHFSTVQELDEKKAYFRNLLFNVKQLFYKINESKTAQELTVLFRGLEKKTEDQKINEKNIEYNIDLITLYERMLFGATKEADEPGKRIKNIGNAIWKIINHMLMSDSWSTFKSDSDFQKTHVPVENKYISKCSPGDVDSIKDVIYLLALIFATQYTTFIREITESRSLEKEIEVNIKEFLNQRFQVFKLMVQTYSPDIMCLQEDDYDHNFDSDPWFMKTYGFVRCKKVPSRAMKMLLDGSGSSLTSRLKEDIEFKKTVCADGCTIMYKKQVFHDSYPEKNNRLAKKDKSPYLVKYLIHQKTGKKFFVVTAHLESGNGDYCKERIRMNDIDDILSDPDFLEMKDEIMDPETNLIICMDGNSPFLDEKRFNDYYSKDSVVAGGESASFIEGEIQIDGKKIAKNSMTHRLMSGFRLNQDNVCVETPTEAWSVNRFRGPDSNQLAKIFESEYHCIDYGFARCNEYKLLKTMLPRIVDTGDDYQNLLPNYQYESLDSIADVETMLSSPPNYVPSEKYNWGPLLNNDNVFVDPYLEDFVSISDHLPLFMVWEGL